MNWYGTGISSFFRVKDERAFRDEMNEIGGVEIVYEDSKDEHPIRRFALLDGYGEGWPSYMEYENENGNMVQDEDFYFFGAVSMHLEDGEVAVFQEIGAEGHRYVSGYSIAINNAGEELVVDIHEIFEKIKEAGWNAPEQR